MKAVHFTVFIYFVLVSAERQPRYSNEWAVEMKNCTKEEADTVAARLGLRNFGKVGSIENVYRFVHEEGTAPAKLTEKTFAILNEAQVINAEQQIAKERVKKGYLPPIDPKWKEQWSLKNTGQTNGPLGLDLNVEKAWLQGITGKGVLVGVVDDGLEWTHPDIYGNYDPSASHDFENDDSDPSPDPAYGDDEPNSHGTGCAGEIGMVKNGRCGIGVAYQSTIASLKFDLSSDTVDSEEASALGYLSDRIIIYSNSWGPSDYGFFVDGPESLTKTVFSNGAHTGRGGKGSIYVWAAGNGGEYYDSCAADGYVNSIYTIAVGSADQNGKQADYDESCTAKMVVTYSYNSDTFPTSDDSWDAYNQITTLDLNNGCTDGFTGTSASTPLVSATIALVLEANPQLSWRDVQYLLVYTSDTTKLSGGDWKTNGAGLKVSSKFGFGAVDAEAMVTRARNWINVPQQLHSSLYREISATYGYAQSYSSFTSIIHVSSTSTNIRFLEHVLLNLSLSLSLSYYDTSYDYDDIYHHYDVKKESDSFPDFEDMEYQNSKTVDDNYPWLTADHARRGDIMVELRSPHGTVSTLLPYRNFDYINAEGYDNWPFMSVHHWGENPVGSWTITVTYKNSHAEVIVTVNGFDIYGTSQEPEAVSRIPKTCDPACARGCAAAGPKYCDACKDFRDQFNLECVSECTVNETEYSHYCLYDSDTSMLPVPTHSSQPTHSSHEEPVPTIGNQNEHSKQKHKLLVIIPSVVGGVIIILILVVACAVVAVFIARRGKQQGRGISYRHIVQVEDV